MMDKKKVLHIGFRHSINDVRIFMKECTSLAKSDALDVSYIVSDINSEINSDRKNNVRRIVLASAPRRFVRQFIYNRQIKEMLKKEPADVLHLHETPLLLIALWAKRRGMKVIFDSHEDYYKQYITNHGRLVAKLYKMYEKHVCKRIDAVIFPCRMLEDEPFDYPVKRLVFIDNYPIVEAKDFADRNEEKSDFLACYTGTISVNRGVMHAVKAWHKAGIKGILAGKYGTEAEKEAIESIPEFASADYIGFLPFDEINKVYEKASVGMATILNRGQYHKTCNLPTKVGEYMIAGIPTILYRTKYVEDLLRDYRFGIAVDPENVEEIAEALLLLKNNPEKQRKMAEEGRRAIKEFFNWKTQEEKLFQLYSELLRTDLMGREKH